MKPKSQWSDAHGRLKRLYEQRVPKGMSQKEFGKRFGIGAQSMVAQYLNGDRPLNFEAAVKFADALGVSIYDISPEMGDWVKDKLLPVLGKAYRRAAMIAAIVVSASLLPCPKSANAQDFSGSSVQPSVYYVKRKRGIMRSGIGRILAMLSAICRALGSTTSALLKPLNQPCARLSGILPSSRTRVAGSSWPFSLPSWLRNIQTSPKLFGAQ